MLLFFFSARPSGAENDATVDTNFAKVSTGRNAKNSAVSGSGLNLSESPTDSAGTSVEGTSGARSAGKAGTSLNGGAVDAGMGSSGSASISSSAKSKAAAERRLLYEKNTEEFKQIISQNMPKWDLNNDGKLSISEINKAIFDPSNTGDAACALAAIHGAQRKATKTVGSNEDDSQLNGGTIEIMDPAKIRKYGIAFLSAKKKLGRHSQLLFASSVPHLESMRQGKTGDCYLIASLGSLAVNRPDELCSLVKSTDNGKFDVYFPGREPVLVDAPTEAEFATFGESGGDGIWLNVFEKAFGQVRLGTASEQEDSDMYDKISGGKSGTVISLLTGHKTKRYSFKDEKARSEVRDAMLQALKEHRLMTCGIKTAVPNTDKSRGHVVAVLSYDASQDQVNLWNPWGTSIMYKDVGIKMKNGIFSMPVSDWLNRFSSMTVETDQPADSRSHTKKTP